MYSFFRGNMSHGKGGENVKKVTKIEGSKSNKRRKNRVAAYIRVSTSMDAQTESFDAQERHYQELFKQRRDWEPVGIYADEGVSGTSMQNRQGIQRLLDDCRNGKIDLVLTKSISRFARNLTECLEAIRELSTLGIAVHFDKENLNTQQMDGELLLSMLSALAESESKSISDNSKWSFKKRVENGTFRHSVAPFGYDLNEGQLIINEEKANIVRDIFNWYLSGDGAYVIAGRLNEMGIDLEKGRQWRDNSVLYILKNERYIGDALFQKTFTDENYQRHWNDYDVDMLYIEGSHESIISREVFNQVQTLLDERKERICNKDTTVYSNRYPLTSRIQCQNCGVSFIRRTHYTNDQSYIAWTCSNHLMGAESCGIKFIKELHLEEAFVTLLNKLVFGRNEIIEATIKKLEISDFDATKSQKDIEMQLKEIQDKLYTLSKLLNSKTVDITFYHKEETALLQEKKKLLAQLRRIETQEHQYSYQLQALKELYEVVNRREYFDCYDATLLEQFVEKIHVFSRDSVVFELTCGLRLREKVRI